MSAWGQKDVALLRAFVNDLFHKQVRQEGHPDEVFPAALDVPFTGENLAGAADNTFLTYTQLRGKVAAIFGDDWVRSGKDLFKENVHLFGGADFQTRYDETNKPSATFLAGLEMMSRDVASRAYLTAAGPFVGLSQSLPSPLEMRNPDAAYRAEITRLYRRMLFRAPTEDEVRKSFGFLQGVYRSKAGIAGQSHDLAFEVTVTGADGQSTTRGLVVRVTNDPRSLYQELVDETVVSEEKLLKKTLAQPFTFRPGDADQNVLVSNENTSGNVSVAAIELKGPLPATETQTLPISLPTVRAEGAWRLNQGDPASYEDGDTNKGKSWITFPIAVKQPGRYEVTLAWRNPKIPDAGGAGRGNRRRRQTDAADMANNVLVEVVSHDRSRLAVAQPPAVPPAGEAHFSVDQTIDNIAFWDLETPFQFADEKAGVEIHNGGTRRRVVADAVKFVPLSGGPEILVDNGDADGADKWSVFDDQNFKPYNVTGVDCISDGSAQKGDLHLLYRPSKNKEAWNPKSWYRVLAGFPGKSDNETRAPIVIHAQASAPILRLNYPVHAHVGAPVEISLAGSYNVQHSPLRSTWRQIGGPRVALKDAHAAQLAFAAPALTPHQAAWEGLCRALMQHPDFLFTRPRSMTLVKDAKERRRLQLVKVAQDLVGRTPTDAELRRLEGGAPIGALVDEYLKGQEFRDFYFRRVRLYLESHGSEVEDEPARLWSYIAFNDRPFKELLTADYSVDTQFRRQQRAGYHGKTGLLTMKGFIQGKPGLPHFNYAAQVAEKFLGYVFVVPPEVVAQREGITAISTTNASTVCYTCHKVLTPLAYQRERWTDDGDFREHDDTGLRIDDSDRDLVPSYPFPGTGMEAFALQAQNKERFIRTIIQTHFVWYFGREMRFDQDERGLYRRLWDTTQKSHFALRPLIRAIVTSPEYLEGPPPASASPGSRPRGMPAKASRPPRPGVERASRSSGTPPKSGFKTANRPE
jgi:hypothetical protein